MSIIRTRDTVRSHYTWGTQDRFETTRPKRMRPRPVLHETKTKTNYCETETKKRSWELNIPHLFSTYFSHSPAKYVKCALYMFRSHEASIDTWWLLTYVEQFCCCGCCGSQTHVCTMVSSCRSRRYWKGAEFVQVKIISSSRYRFKTL